MRRILLVSFVFCVGHILSTTVIPPSFDDLVEQAEIIIEGQVTGIESKWVGQNETRRIKTYYTFRVTETLKGKTVDTYTLEVLGGTVGDVTLKVEGAPNFLPGEQAILFITKNGVQFVPLVGIMHGHYRFKRDEKTNQNIIVKHDGTALHNIEEIGKNAAESGGRLGKLRAKQSQGTTTPLTPGDMKNQIREKIKILSQGPR